MAQAEENDSAPKHIHVEREDRLIAENLNLKLVAAVSRETILQMQLNEATKERMQRTQDLQQGKQGLEAKYGISLATHTIREEDGLVVPRTAGQGAHKL